MTPPDLAAWAALSSARKETFSRRFARELPRGFAFTGVRRHELEGVSGEAAHFTGPDGAAWVLVPGGEVRLGFDAAGWAPTAEEAEDWAELVEEYAEVPGSGPTADLRERVAEVTSRPRTVSVPSLLVEVAVRELGWRAAEIFCDEERDAAAALDERPDATVHVYRDDRHVRVRRAADGSHTAEEGTELTAASIAAAVRADGFRHPTADEWEHLCGGGARTLWRWGDHAPTDRYPTDRSPAEAAWRRDWVLSGGALPHPPGGFEDTWDLHRRPNALGLHIAADPYRNEVVEDGAGAVVGTRGGDGGCAICGGEGFVAGWLPLATAWCDPDFCDAARAFGFSVGFTFGRRVLELG